MIAPAYQEFCEAMFRDWLRDELSLEPSLAHRFLMDHAPEPYLRFGNGTQPFSLLLTNPGSGMKHQERGEVLARRSCIDPDCSYFENARGLAEFYGRDLPPGGARTRNAAIESIRDLLGCDSVIQYETIPFHSASIANKGTLAGEIRGSTLLQRYSDELRIALQSTSVLALSAVESARSVDIDSVRRSPWLRWQADLMGLCIDRARVVALKRKGVKISCGLIFDRTPGRFAAFVLTMGSSSFPSEDGRVQMAEALIGPSPAE